VSFLDETEEPPRRGPARRAPRRPTGPADRTQLLIRRGIAIGGAVLLIFLLFLAVKSCRSAAKEQAFKDYNRDVGAFVQESEDQSQGLFDLLERGGQSPVELQNTVNGYASEAAQLVDRAKGTDHPGELDSAHRYLVETLEFRRDGLKGIADQLPQALGDRGEEATNAIAGQMQNFLTSDVVYQQRFYPRLQAGLEDEDLLDSEKPPESSFLRDIEWLVPATVADRIERISSGEGGGGGSGGPPEPGLHGTGLGTVSVQPGGAQLNEGGATQIKAAPNLSLDVQVSNQGEHDEQNVTVRVAIRGAGNPIELEEKLPEIAAGQTKTVSLPLSSTPPAGRPVTIRVEIVKVPGEEKTDNNRASFPAVFSG
jgi:CARDB